MTSNQIEATLQLQDTCGKIFASQIMSQQQNSMVSPQKTVRRLSDLIEHDHLTLGSKSLVLKLFPHWQASELQFIQCKDGITNKLTKCIWTKADGSEKQTVLIRVFGQKSELFIDRETELTNLLSLNTFGLAPPVYACFRNGIVYGFIEGAPLTVDDMHDKHKSSLIAKVLASWHRSPVVADKKPHLFSTLHNWLAQVPSSYPKPAIQSVYEKNIRLSWIADTIQFLETQPIPHSSPIVFCHNDLLSANIIYEPAKAEIFFIDYEYGAYNYRGFDIANHFCEYAGFECDYTRYPDKKTQLDWITSYLKFLHDTTSPSKDQVEKVYEEVRFFSLTSHIYWGLWALVQSYHSNIDFDYMGYACKRFLRLAVELNQMFPDKN